MLLAGGQPAPGEVDPSRHQHTDGRWKSAGRGQSMLSVLGRGTEGKEKQSLVLRREEGCLESREVGIVSAVEPQEGTYSVGPNGM